RRVRSDKKVEELSIGGGGVLDDLLDMDRWLDVEIIADMPGSNTGAQQATPPTARLLGALDLHGGFNRKRGVADPAGARHEYHDGRSHLFVVDGSDVRPIDARNDV